MNLGIEYLVRTGAIRNFFQTPCSLFVEHWLGGRLAIEIENKSGRSKFYLVTHYHLDELSEDERLPRSENYKVPKSKVFVSSKVVLPGDYILLPYAEQPIDNCHNRYNHPMDERTYNHFIGRYLHSEAHKQHREQWLWKSFVNLHFKRPILELLAYESYHRSSIVFMEQSTVQTEEPDKWSIWVMWRKKLLRSTRVASELVFQSAYH